MREIDAAFLRDLAPESVWTIARDVAPVLQARLGPAGIDTPLRVAHFLGQAIYETAFLRRLEENLHYSAGYIALKWPELKPRAAALSQNLEALANAVYAGRFGNGDEAGGDGWRFRGRGLFMLTFRDNYKTFASEEYPDTVAAAPGAVESAVKYWLARNINEPADADNIAEVTRRVQGGSDGISERAMLKHRALRMLTIS